MINLFQRKPRGYITPGGKVYTLFDDMAKQPHLLIAGATGSGKSVVVNGIIFNLLHRGPASAGLILIDPKRVELAQYKDCPHVIRYASEPDTMPDALRYALAVTESRYKEMQRQSVRKYQGGDVYVIIDELADLMTTQKKAVLPLIQRLCQIGRAAKVHVIACTQCPIVKVLPTEIKVNFDSRVALRTSCAQDSRNIMRKSGCELLPRYGKGYYITPEGLNLWNIPMYSESQVEKLVSYWTSEECIA